MGHHHYITTPPNIIRSSVADLIGNVARHVAGDAATVCTPPTPASTRGSSLLPPPSPPPCRHHYSPASIYARLVIASSAALAVTLDLIELVACQADEMLSRAIRRMVLKPARMAYIMTSVTAGQLRYAFAVRPLPGPAPYELDFLESPKMPPTSWRRSTRSRRATGGSSTPASTALSAMGAVHIP